MSKSSKRSRSQYFSSLSLPLFGVLFILLCVVGFVCAGAGVIENAHVFGETSPPHTRALKINKQRNYNYPKNKLKLTGAERVVRVAHKRDGRDGVAVREQAAVAVAKVEAPHLQVFVGAAADEQRAVAADVHARDGQLVAVEGEKELERVHKEDLHRGVQEADSDEAAVLAEAEAGDALVQLERPLVDEAEDLALPLWSSYQLKVPELDCFVSAAGYDPPSNRYTKIIYTVYAEK